MSQKYFPGEICVVLCVLAGCLARLRERGEGGGGEGEGGLARLAQSPAVNDLI